MKRTPSAQRILTIRERELLALFAVGPDGVARFGSDEIIPDWKVVKDVFLTLGAKWKTGKPKGGFYFPAGIDAVEVVSAAVATGEIVDGKLVGFFETPEALADELVEVAMVFQQTVAAPDRRVLRALEPSFGKGRIVAALVAAGCHVDGIELLEENVRACAKRFAKTANSLSQGDFLATAPPTLNGYDIVVMNPPFERQADIDHVLHAFRFLCNGGRLVSVMSAGGKFRDDHKSRDFRQFVENRGGEIRDLPAKSFHESGTDVNTVMVVLDRK